MSMSAEHRAKAVADFSREYATPDGNLAKSGQKFFLGITVGDRYQTGSAMKTLAPFIPEYVQYAAMYAVTSTAASHLGYSSEGSEAVRNLRAGYEQLLEEVWPTKVPFASESTILQADERSRRGLVRQSLEGEYRFSLVRNLQDLATFVSRGAFPSVEDAFDSQRYLHDLPNPFKALVFAATLETQRDEALRVEDFKLADTLQEVIDEYLQEVNTDA